MGNKLKTATVLLLLAVSFASSKACHYDSGHPLCCFSSKSPFNRITPEDWIVYPHATCNGTDGTINIQVFFNTSFEGEFNVDLYYVCVNGAGDTTGVLQPVSYNPQTQNNTTVGLNESFLESGASCAVFGCYEPYPVSPIHQKFYEMANGTCSFNAPRETSETTSVPQSTTTSSPDNMATNPTPNVTLAGPDPPPVDRDQVTTVVLLVVFFVIAGVCIIVLLGILLRFKQVQRRKQSLMWFYNYSEPIDPYFNPININAPVKRAVSDVSVFDTFSPVKPQPDTSDDDRSEVLQGTGRTEDRSSIESIVFSDDSGLVLSSRTPQEEAALSVHGNDSSSREPSVIFNGYVSNVTAAHEQSIQVSDGYVLEPKSQASAPSTALASANYVEDSAPKTEQKQFRVNLNSTSSGYVTDLSTPEYRSYPGVFEVTLETEEPPSLKPLECKYTTLNNGYMVVASQLHLKSKATPPEEDLDSVYYNEDLEESSNDEGEQDSENVVTECSLSINPLHFEPVNYDELMHGQTSPSYVNTVYSTQ